ncbi:outer membrane beta-barrel protein [Rhodanobacter sp. L36]|uniref:outer membrane beta-barrel protein n=1 Tax=Rhodanobacter sp. L36 TaxID=1747221 RepID=UPI00131D439A|nr:outer membrane beta-barrel protein [Rhodanobacter sp. L36]
MPVSIKLRRIATAIALTLLSGAASAAQFDYTLYAGVEHSDNIDLSPNNPVSENVLIPGMNFTFVQAGSRVQANVAGNLEYRDYLGGSFSNQLFAQVSGQVNWTLLPQRLDFEVDDYAGVQPVASLATNSPDNQQQTNVLLVGPTLHFMLGDSLRGQAELRYINSTAQKTKEFDSNRGQGALRIFKDLSATDQLSVNIESQHVDFENQGGGPNYDRDQIFGRYVSKLALFDIDAMAGWSRIRYDQAKDATTPLAQVSISWRPVASSTFTAAAGRQYSDAAQDMMVQPGQQLIPAAVGDISAGGGRGISTGDAIVGSQVYVEQRFEGIYAYTAERLSFRVAPFFRKLSYLNDPTFDEKGRGGSIGVDYRLPGQLLLSAYGNTERLTYQFLDRQDKHTAYGLSLSSNRTPHWGWRVSYTHDQQSSTDATQSYRENEIYVGIVFKR